MVKIIDYKKIDLTDAEFDFYKHLVSLFSDDAKKIKGDIYFKDLFEVDEDGFITLIKTDKSVPWAIIFFLQQCMIMQRLRFIDEFKKGVKGK